MNKFLLIGLDVYADTIAVALAEPVGGEVRSLDMIPNRPASIRKLMKKLGWQRDWIARRSSPSNRQHLGRHEMREGCSRQTPD